MAGFDEDEENMMQIKEAELRQEKEMKKQILLNEKSNLKYRNELNIKLDK
jgi:hypothetical protein